MLGDRLFVRFVMVCGALSALLIIVVSCTSFSENDNSNANPDADDAGAVGDGRSNNSDGNGGSSSGAQDATPVSSLAVSTLPQVAVLAGDVKGVSLIVQILRPPNDTNAGVNVTLDLPTDVIAAPPSIQNTTEAIVTFELTANSDATPARRVIPIHATSATSGSASATFSLLVSREYRTPNTYNLTVDSDQTFFIMVWGSGGGPGNGIGPLGGAAGYAEGAFALVKGAYPIQVGSPPTSEQLQSGVAGMPGGGNVGAHANGSTGGGGYSAVFDTFISFESVLIIAGGGGGAAEQNGGGAGGGTGGGSDGSGPGGGLASTQGGGSVGDGLATNGLQLMGGNGSNGTPPGAGGGGGYYGGGGGGATAVVNVGPGGGGGGSSYVAFTLAGSHAVDGGTLGGQSGSPGNGSSPRRNGAGDPKNGGAVIVIPQ